MMGFFILSVCSDSPLRLNASNSSYYFSPALFFLQLKDFFGFFVPCLFLALLIQKPVGFCLNLRNGFATVTLSSFACAICKATPLHVQLVLLEKEFLQIFLSFFRIVLFVFVILQETEKENRFSPPKMVTFLKPKAG